MSNTERRQFARVHFASGAELITTQEHLACQVVDISLKGVLLQLPEGRTPTVGMPCLVKPPLSTRTSPLPWLVSWPMCTAAKPACCAAPSTWKASPTCAG